MLSLLRLLLTFRVFSPVLRPLTRLLVGAIAIPLFRVFLRRVVRLDQLDKELSKDLEQWFRGSLLLLVATANMEDYLFGWVPLDLNGDYAWLAVGMRILLAMGVIEAMPDVDLFPIIHPGPSRLLFPKVEFKTLPNQAWRLLKALLCRHLDRSSAVLAILAAIFTGPVGWICYGLAILQFLIIGLVTSRDKALNALNSFDRQVEIRRRELLQADSQSSAEGESAWLAVGAGSEDRSAEQCPSGRGESHRLEASLSAQAGNPLTRSVGLRPVPAVAAVTAPGADPPHTNP